MRSVCMRSSLFACPLSSLQLTFSSGPCPRYWCLMKLCKHSGFRFSSPNLLSTSTACRSVPGTAERSFREARVEILLRSDLTRVPLGVLLPHMILTHSQVPVGAVIKGKPDWSEPVCRRGFVCELSAACQLSRRVLVYSQKTFSWGM